MEIGSSITGGTLVVHANMRVYGTDNLFVVDASIFPGQVSTNPSAYIVIAGEQAVAKILALSTSAAVLVVGTTLLLRVMFANFTKFALQMYPTTQKKEKSLYGLEAGTLANSDLTCSMHNAAAAAAAGQALLFGEQLLHMEYITRR